MAHLEKLEQLAAQVAKLLPAGDSQLRDDLQQNLKSTLGAALSRMDLVTREEFEVQQALLQRTREKLVRLQEQVDALEQARSKSTEPG